MNKNRAKSDILLCLIAIIIIMSNYVYGAESVILGDINRDGKVDSMDLLYIMRHIIAESSEEHKDWLLEGERLKIADITENGKVDSSDMLVILRYIAANNNSEEIGKKHPEWLEQKEIELKSFSEIKEEAEVIDLKKDTNYVKEENIIENIVEEECTESNIRIKLNKSLIEMEKGTTEQIIATIEPRESNQEKIEWKTINNRIAEVDVQGKITAKENGETLLIARTEDGKEAVSKVIVGTKIREIVTDKEEVKIDLSERRTEKIEIKVEPEEASNKEITVESSNGNVAAIDGEGKITARTNGEAELTIKASNGIEKKVKVAVTTSATGIKLDKNYMQLDLSKNKESKILATVEPSTASNKEITYMSSNEEIATVDKEGKITAKGNGEANIIVRTSNGKEAVCKVEVKTEVTEIEMEEEVKIDLSKEKEKKITVEVKPNNAKTKAVMIRSNNEEVATIDANGTIKAKKNGTAIITAEVVGTDISKTCKVIVTTSPTGLKLNKTSVNLDLSGTKTTKLTAEVEPATSSNKKIKWTNGNGNVVNMSTSGGTATITGIKNAETTITAKIVGTNISQKCKVIVTTSPQSIKLNKTNITLDKDKTITLTATVNPSTSINKNVIWSSSNTSVATVDKNGKVTAKKGGTAIVTAKTVNEKIATCKVTVRAGYWEIKNNKYIYHYLDGTTKEWTVSEYIAWNKLKDQKVKVLDPKAYKRSGNKIYYAGMWQRYYCLDETANRIAEKNGGSPYAVTVDIDRKHESIFKNNGTNEKPIWEPIKSSRCRVGGKWKNFNNGKGTNDPRYYKKDTLTPIGLYYTNGNHSNIAVESYWKGKPPYWVGFGINYKWFDDGCCKDDYLHNSAFDLYNGPGTGGCVAVGEELSKWIYYNCGRGTPILIW